MNALEPDNPLTVTQQSLDTNESSNKLNFLFQ